MWSCLDLGCCVTHTYRALEGHVQWVRSSTWSMDLCSIPLLDWTVIGCGGRPVFIIPSWVSALGLFSLCGHCRQHFVSINMQTLLVRWMDPGMCALGPPFYSKAICLHSQGAVSHTWYRKISQTQHTWETPVGPIAMVLCDIFPGKRSHLCLLTGGQPQSKWFCQCPAQRTYVFTVVTYRSLDEGLLIGEWMTHRQMSLKAHTSLRHNSWKLETWNSLQDSQAPQQIGDSFLFSIPYCLYNLREGGALWIKQISGIFWDLWVVKFLSFNFLFKLKKKTLYVCVGI